MAFHWTYTQWQEDIQHELIGTNLLVRWVQSTKFDTTVSGLVFYADSSYLSCRILMLASRAVHHEALYCAAQAVEKYLKALILSRIGSDEYHDLKPGHNLYALAKGAAKHFTEFADEEFLAFCSELQAFEVVGRYPEHTVGAFQYVLELLTFLDHFIAHCRDLLGSKVGERNLIRELLSQDCQSNPFMLCATRAVAVNNRHISKLTK